MPQETCKGGRNAKKLESSLLETRKEDYLVTEYPRVNLSAAITDHSPSSRFILFDASKQPYRVLLDSGANVSFISKTFATNHSLPFVELEPFPIFLVSSSTKPSYWVLKKAKWFFDFPSFPNFEWDLFVLDAPGMDDTILGHDFLVHWNPDVNWKEGVINLRAKDAPLTSFPSFDRELNSSNVKLIQIGDELPPGELQYPDLSLTSTNHGIISYLSPLPITTFFEEKPLSFEGAYLHSLTLTNPPGASFPSFDDKDDV